MALQETSLEAYHAIAPTLARRERSVLVGLDGYVAANHEDPTAYELFEWMKAHAYPVSDINDVRPRLTELKDRGELYNPEKRHCRIKGRTAMTWRRWDGRLF